jgi:hypothetical protein
VCLTVTDGTNISQTSATITVTNPDTVFSGTNTRCFSNDADFTGCPTGATQVTTSDFDSAVNTHLATGRRLLFKRGHIFTASTSSQIDVDGPGIIGAYGTAGARPIIRHSGVQAILPGDRAQPGLDDWRIMDLEFDGQSSTSAYAIYGTQGNVGQVNRWLILRCHFHHMRAAVMFSEDILDAWNSGSFPGHQIYNEIFVVDSVTNNIVGESGSYSFYGSAHRLALLGNDLDNDNTGSHTVRILHTQRAAITNNRMAGGGTTAGVGRHTFKLHAYNWNVAGVSNPGGVGTWSEYVVVGDNAIEGGEEFWIAAVGPQSAAPSEVEEYVRHVIFERNKFVASSTTTQMLTLWANQISVRNNLFVLTGAADPLAILAERRGAENVHQDLWVYNNTFFSSSSGIDATVLWLDNTYLGAVFRNNLAYMPSASSVDMIFGSGGAGQPVAFSANSGDAQARTTSPNFVNPAPTLASPVTDFKIQSPSYAIDAGVAVPVRSDIEWEDRPKPGGGAYDIGFDEF